MKSVVIILAGAMLLASATMALAVDADGHGHGKEPGGKQHGKHRQDAQMARLHKMMPRYARAQVSIDSALRRGDRLAIAKETAYLLSTTADLKQSKPHKNPGGVEEFKEIAAGFELDVKLTADSAKRGDLAGAKAAFASARKQCDACHKRFRD